MEIPLSNPTVIYFFIRSGVFVTNKMCNEIVTFLKFNIHILFNNNALSKITVYSRNGNKITRFSHNPSITIRSFEARNIHVYKYCGETPVIWNIDKQ